MKKTIAILLILILTGFSLFATETPITSTEGPSTIVVKSSVADFSAFGLSEGKLTVSSAFNSIQEFQAVVSSTISKTIPMLSLKEYVTLGYLSGINNTSTKVDLIISVSDLASDSSSIALKLQTTEASIPASSNHRFGTLKDVAIKVQEKNPGDAALAPAGTYSATITIALKTG